MSLIKKHTWTQSVRVLINQKLGTYTDALVSPSFSSRHPVPFLSFLKHCTFLYIKRILTDIGALMYNKSLTHNRSFVFQKNCKINFQKLNTSYISEESGHTGNIPLKPESYSYAYLTE